ncbi:MAG: cytochrome P450 [Bacteroidota bacterium]
MAVTPPTVPSGKALRRLIPFALDPLKGFDRYFQEYGPSFFLKAGRGRRTLVTVDPQVAQAALQREHKYFEKSEIQSDQMAKYLGRGLLTNNGSDWLRQRRLIQPGFHRKRLLELIQGMQAECNRIGDETLAPAARSGRAIEVHELMTVLTFRIIARAIFTDGFSPKQTTEFSEAVTRIQSFIIYPIRLPFMRPIYRLIGQEQKYRKLAGDIGLKLLDRVNERRAATAPKSDLLQMLLDSRYEDTGEPMNDQQLIDEIMIIFAAGHETSANALTWTIHLLMQHEDILERCREEAQSVMPNGTADLEKLSKLKYIQQVLEESMRLYPPAWVTDRIATQAVEVAGIKLRKNEVVVPYIYGLHRSEAIYDAPAVFDPDRMTTEKKRNRHPFSYIPFGGGPRLCIGHHFAMMEMKLVLAYCLQNWDFRRWKHSPNAIQPKALLTLRPNGQVNAFFRPLSPKVLT